MRYAVVFVPWRFGAASPQPHILQSQPADAKNDRISLDFRQRRAPQSRTYSAIMNEHRDPGRAARPVGWGARSGLRAGGARRGRGYAPRSGACRREAGTNRPMCSKNRLRLAKKCRSAVSLRAERASALLYGCERFAKPQVKTLSVIRVRRGVVSAYCTTALLCQRARKFAAHRHICAIWKGCGKRGFGKGI